MLQEGSKADIAGFGMINVTTKANSDILQVAELKVIIENLLFTFTNKQNIKFIRKSNAFLSKVKVIFL